MCNQGTKLSLNFSKILAKMHILMLNTFSALANFKVNCLIMICKSHRCQSGFSNLAVMLDAILDFSARHHLCQFMPAVSCTTDCAEHFVSNKFCYTEDPGPDIFGLYCNPTNSNTAENESVVESRAARFEL